MTVFFGATDNEEVIGRRALGFFHEASRRYSEYGPKSLEELEAVLGKKAIPLKEGLGLAISATQISDQKVKAAMEALATAGHGRVPASINDWFSPIRGQAVKVSTWEATKHTVVETAKTLVEGAVKVGDAVIGTSKLLPVAVLAGVAAYVYSKLKKHTA